MACHALPCFRNLRISVRVASGFLTQTTAQEGAAETQKADITVLRKRPDHASEDTKTAVCLSLWRPCVGTPACRNDAPSFARRSNPHFSLCRCLLPGQCTVQPRLSVRPKAERSVLPGDKRGVKLSLYFASRGRPRSTRRTQKSAHNQRRKSVSDALGCCVFVLSCFVCGTASTPKNKTHTHRAQTLPRPRHPGTTCYFILFFLRQLCVRCSLLYARAGCPVCTFPSW